MMIMELEIVDLKSEKMHLMPPTDYTTISNGQDNGPFTLCDSRSVNAG